MFKLIVFKYLLAGSDRRGLSISWEEFFSTVSYLQVHNYKRAENDGSHPSFHSYFLSVSRIPSPIYIVYTRSLFLQLIFQYWPPGDDTNTSPFVWRTRRVTNSE